jgi:hypothetical protein
VDDQVVLRNGEKFSTDLIIMATGFVKSCQAFPDTIKPLCGLAPNPLDEVRWAKLEEEANKKVDELLPVLSRPPVDLQVTFGRAQVAKEQKLSYGPCRHYRRMISPYLAAQGDRSLFFSGLMHNIYTPMVVEVQALWGVAYMLGLHDVPSLDVMEKEAALWNAWTGKRYRGIGKKHSYAIFDFQSVSLIAWELQRLVWLTTLFFSTLIRSWRISEFERPARATPWLSYLFPRDHATTVVLLRNSDRPYKQDVTMMTAALKS